MRFPFLNTAHTTGSSTDDREESRPGSPIHPDPSARPESPALLFPSSLPEDLPTVSQVMHLATAVPTAAELYSTAEDASQSDGGYASNASSDISSTNTTPATPSAEVVPKVKGAQPRSARPCRRCVVRDARACDRMKPECGPCAALALPCHYIEWTNTKCNHCAIKNRKCDRAKPECASCRQRGFVCCYDVPVYNRRKCLPHKSPAIPVTRRFLRNISNTESSDFTETFAQIIANIPAMDVPSALDPAVEDPTALVMEPAAWYSLALALEEELDHALDDITTTHTL